MRYAGGIVVVQVLWVLRTWLFPHGNFGWVLFAALVAMELAIPYFAEHAGPHTPWHPHHIAERYELLTIITLGEVILASTQVISSSLDANGVSGEFLMLIGGALMIVFSIWWAYFKRPMVESLNEESPFVFGYVHYFVFASVAATGACIGVLNDVIQGEADISARLALLLLAGCISTYVVLLATLHALADGRFATAVPAIATAAVLFGCALIGSAGISVLLIGLTLAVAMALFQRGANRSAAESSALQ